jgi:hypothetical protein
MQVFQRPLPAIGRVGFLAVVAVAVFAGGLGVGAGFASTGAQTSAQIHGCASRYTGALRIANGPDQCSSGERAISWNQQGPGGILDIQQIEKSIAIRTEDESERFQELVHCPEGYTIRVSFAGGAIISGIWAVTSSAPLKAGTGTLETDAWLAALKTTDGEPAEGVFLFDAKAICALLA